MKDFSSFTDKPWRKLFRDPSQMTETPLEMLVEKFLPPGVTFIGGPAGHGKSWLSLSLAKALFRATPFVNNFKVPHANGIVYLVPEVGESAMKQRLRLLDLGGVKDGILLHTMSQGSPLDLMNIDLMAAMKDLEPIVFLDTAARFNKGEDENAVAENKRFVDGVFNLLQKGAKAVIPLHHSTKSLASGEITPTLENVLRGSGDFGAMADAVYCSICYDKKNFISEITNVKARDFDPTESFEIQGRPYIDETHDLHLLRGPDLEKEDFHRHQAMKTDQILSTDPWVSQNELARRLNVRKDKAKYYANMSGWNQDGKKWEKRSGTGSRLGIS
jgi:hypothetical protein